MGEEVRPVRPAFALAVPIARYVILAYWKREAYAYSYVRVRLTSHIGMACSFLAHFGPPGEMHRLLAPKQEAR